MHPFYNESLHPHRPHPCLHDSGTLLPVLSTPVLDARVASSP